MPHGPQECPGPALDGNAEAGLLAHGSKVPKPEHPKEPTSATGNPAASVKSTTEGQELPYRGAPLKGSLVLQAVEALEEVGVHGQQAESGQTDPGSP